MRAGGPGLFGLPGPARRHRLRTVARACHLRPPDARTSDSSSRALSLPFRVPRSRAGPALMSGLLPWAFFPHRGVSVRSPHSRASQARFVPSSTFLTSSTASSSAHLRGFVSPRSHVQGSLFRVFPSREAARARHPPLPSCRCPMLLHPGCPRARNTAPAFRALLLSRIRCNPRWVRPRAARYPPELRPPSGSPSRTVPATFTASSDHGLSRPSSYHPCATCIALASLASPSEVCGLPIRADLRRHFTARPHNQAIRFDRRPTCVRRPKPAAWIQRMALRRIAMLAASHRGVTTAPATLSWDQAALQSVV
jgi:hypothetical protein